MVAYNLKRALEEKGGLSEGWNSVKVVDKKTFKFNTGTDGVEYSLITKDKVKGKISFALTDAAFWRLGLFAKAAGVSEHTLDKFELGDVIGKYVDVLMAPNQKGYLDAKAFAPFESVHGDETSQASVSTAAKQTVPADEEDDIPF